MRYANMFNQESFIFANVKDSNEENFVVNFEYWEIDSATGKYEKEDEIDSFDMISQDKSNNDTESYYTMFGKTFKFNIPFPMFAAEDAISNEEKFANSQKFASNFDRLINGTYQNGYTTQHRIMCRSHLKHGYSR